MVTQVPNIEEVSNGWRRWRQRSDLLPSKPSKLQGLIKETQERTEQTTFRGGRKHYLQQLLSKLTDRDSEKTQNI